MLRRAATLVALAILAATPAPGTEGRVLPGQWQGVSFHAPVSCAVVCPYWLDTANGDLDGDAKEDVYFQACASPDGTAGTLEEVPGFPFEQGTVYDEVLLTAPAGAVALEVQLWPVIDYDGFLCDADTGEELAVLSNVLGYQCENLLPFGSTIPVACTEDAAIGIPPGRRVIFRAYNWSDLYEAPGRYRWWFG